MLSNAGVRPVRDTTTSLSFIDRGLMHVVEHHDDLLSWKKYNNYTHTLTLFKYKCVGCYLNVVINCSCKNTMLSLCWLSVSVVSNLK
jgi:hypothetical protein